LRRRFAKQSTEFTVADVSEALELCILTKSVLRIPHIGCDLAFLEAEAQITSFHFRDYWMFF